MVVNNGNIAPIKRKSKNRGLSKAEVQHALLNWVTGTVPLLTEEPFGDKFRAYYPDYRKLKSHLVQVENGKATITSSEELFAEIWEKMWRFSNNCAELKVEEKVLERVVALFQKTKHRLFLGKAPEIFCWESEKEKIAFNRLEDPPKLGWFWPSPEFVSLAPLYSNFIQRCQHSYEVRQFLGSLLDVNADRKMVLWNWGDANAGKSTFLTTLFNGIFGDRGFTSLEINPDDNAFMKESLVNKLAAFGDEVDPKFLKSNLFKQLTGSKEHGVNPKGKTAFNAAIRCKFIFASNQMPELPRENSFTTRVLLNRVDSIDAEMQLKEWEVERRLREEFPFILADIKQAYEELGGKKIKIPEGNHVQSNEAYDEPCQLVFDTLFEYVAKDENGDPYCEMTSAHFGELLTPKLNYRDVTQRKFYKFLKDRFGIQVGVVIKYRGKSTRMVPFLRKRR